MSCAHVVLSTLLSGSKEVGLAGRQADRQAGKEAPTNSIAGEKLSVPPPCLVHCSSSPGDRNGEIETQSGIWPVSCSVWALETRWQGCGQFFDQFLVFSMISL